jgi:hypothetical protein
MSERRGCVSMLPSTLRRVSASSRKPSAGSVSAAKLYSRGPIQCRRADFGRRWFSEQKDKETESLEYADVAQQSAAGARDRAAVGVSTIKFYRFVGVKYRNSQVFTPTAAALFIATGAGLFWYFKNEKEKLQQKKRSSHLISKAQTTTYQRVELRGRAGTKVVRPGQSWRPLLPYHANREAVHREGPPWQMVVALLRLHELS